VAAHPARYRRRAVLISFIAVKKLKNIKERIMVFFIED
jgi:hypothetical protein